MKESIKLCTKDVNFSFNGTTYEQKDGVAMGSPLERVLASIFMVELEKSHYSKIKTTSSILEMLCRWYYPVYF